MTILVFGMSTTYGAWDIEGGWVQRLRKYFDQRYLTNGKQEKHWETVYNLGISGGNTKDLLKRFENEVKARIWPEETIILINTGKNDAIINNKTGKTLQTETEYQKDLTKIITIAKKYSKKIIMVGSLPVDEKRSDPIPWLAGHSYKNAVNDRFENIFASVSKKEKVFFIDLHSKFKDTNYEKMLEDGVHPNSEGHRLIFETVKEFLIKNKIV